jgi:hypothetical protein
MAVDAMTRDAARLMTCRSRTGRCRGGTTGASGRAHTPTDPTTASPW